MMGGKKIIINNNGSMVIKNNALGANGAHTSGPVADRNAQIDD